MGIGKRGAEPVSPRKCFLAWAEAGNLDRAVQRLAHQGVLGRTGKPLHYNTVRRNSYMFMIENLEEARDILRRQELYFAADDDLWDDFVIQKAKFVLFGGGIVKPFYGWLSKNNLIDQAVRFGHVPEGFSVDRIM